MAFLKNLVIIITDAPLPKVRAKLSKKKKAVEVEEETDHSDEEEQEEAGPSGYRAHSPPAAVEEGDDSEEAEEEMVTTPRQEGKWMMWIFLFIQCPRKLMLRVGVLISITYLTDTYFFGSTI